jgi:hypothetical protein
MAAAGAHKVSSRWSMRTDRVDIPTVLREVERIASSLHKAGTFSTGALRALVRHASARSVRCSAETGSGVSTLLLSHVSDDHTVFALDAGTGSLRSVEISPLLRRETVTFIEGPSQITLPRHTFARPLQLALIDGPHGYPFPDLEYYYLYPHLEAGALLIVDDIQIPTIGNLFDVLSADEMFDLQEVVETTAFFRRTMAPTFPATGDGWWDQRYNRRAFESVPAQAVDGEPPAQTDVPTVFYLDRLGAVANPIAIQQPTIASGDTLVVQGWALDVRRTRPAAAVDLVLDGRTFRTPVRVPRADVVAAQGDHRYLRCGFNAELPAATVTPGLHELEVRILVDDGRSYYSGARLRFAAS